MNVQLWYHAAQALKYNQMIKYLKLESISYYKYTKQAFGALVLKHFKRKVTHNRQYIFLISEFP